MRAFLTSLATLGLLGSALGANTVPAACYKVEFTGSAASGANTIFSYSVTTYSGCTAPSTFSIQTACSTASCGAGGTLVKGSNGFAECNYASLGAGTHTVAITVAGSPDTTTGEWAIQAGKVSMGYTCVPECTTEPTLPNQACSLVVPSSITLSDRYKTPITVSLGSMPSGTVTVAITSDCAFLDKCTLTFTTANWNKAQTFDATNNPAFRDFSCSVDLVATGSDGSCSATVPLTKVQAPAPTALSYGDPYIFTFDSVRFALNSQLTSSYYYLVYQPDTELIIQNSIQPCSMGECNMGVAIRYRTATFTILMSLTGVLTTTTTGTFPTGSSITHPNAETYLMVLNSQLTLNITAIYIPPNKVWSLQIGVSPGVSYKSELAGLMGNYNGNRNDEMMLMDGTQAATLAAFEANWAVPAAQNLFNHPGATFSTLLGATSYVDQTFPFVCQAS